MATVTHPPLTRDPPPAEPVEVARADPAEPGRLRRVVRGRPGDPVWVRPALLGLLAATALLYLWGLGASGWANAFYSAAVQAATKSWKAFFFGSSDAANFITVDKTPGALWVMALSARIFGVNSWSILVPQALEGVATVWFVYAIVRRWFGAGAGLLAGLVMATTPVAALMFRFNNPDALLVLALTAGAYAMVRAVESGRTRWLVLAGSLVGVGFLAKMLQALLVVPAFAVMYLVAGPPRLRRRLGQLAWGGLALAVSAGWWIAAVELIPAADRPYIGGSQNNSVLNLIFGYAGFGRLTGDEAGSVGGGGITGSRWGPTGWFRLFGSEMGTQISWLLPAALMLAGAALVLGWRAGRRDRTRAGLILWGGWLAVTGAVFSLGQGIIHPYYTVALGPAIAGLVGIGAAVMWRRRHDPMVRTVLAATVAITVVWSAVLLRRAPNWNTWLPGVVVVAGLMVAVALVAGPGRGRGLRAAVVAAAVVVSVSGPAAYAISTAATVHTGAIPSAGPAGAGVGPGGARGRPIDGGGGGGGPAGRGGGGGGFAGGAGGLLDATTPSAALVAQLTANGSAFRWVAATIRSEQAAGYQLATGLPVMAIGGFNGTDPAPTLAEFQAYVAHGQIHWFLGGGGQGGGPGGSTSTAATASAITAWVSSHYTAVTVGGVTIYDLTAPIAGSQ